MARREVKPVGAFLSVRKGPFCGGSTSIRTRKQHREKVGARSAAIGPISPSGKRMLGEASNCPTCETVS